MTVNDYDPIVTYNRTAAVSTSNASAAVDLGGATLMGVFVSTDTHKGTSISFQAATLSTGAYHNVLTSTGNTVSITGVSTQAARYYALDPTNFLGLRHIKLVSASTQETVTYTLATRPY